MPHSRLASPSATVAVLKRHGLHTKKALGQHFLIDDNVIARILQLAQLAPDEAVLEIGPGIGTLTWALLDRGARVVAVEYDSRLFPVLHEIGEVHPGLTLVHADAVTVPIARLAGPDGPLRALVANLPYNVAATVVLRFLEEIPSLERAIVMVQSEVADRMAAVPGTGAYGAYTVKLGLRARVSARFPVPRSCFLPPPRVDSAVIRIDRVRSAVAPEILRSAARAADAAFAQRRKTLRNSFAAGLGVAASESERILRAAGIDPSRRAEELTSEEFVAIGIELQKPH